MSQYPVANTTLLKANQKLRVSGRVQLRYRKTLFGLRLWRWVDAVADPRSCSSVDRNRALNLGSSRARPWHMCAPWKGRRGDRDAEVVVLVAYFEPNAANKKRKVRENATLRTWDCH